MFLSKKKKKFNLQLLYFIIFELIGLIVGAKVFSFISNPALYNYKFNFFRSGLSSMGAVIGIIIMFIIYSLIFKVKFIDIMELFLPSIPVMYGVGKIGCFVAGCCYGIEYNGFFHITYYGVKESIDGINLFPIQIIEALVFILIFLYLFKFLYNKKLDYNFLGFSLIIMGLSKFFLDFLDILI